MAFASELEETVPFQTLCVEDDKDARLRGRGAGEAFLPDGEGKGVSEPALSEEAKERLRDSAAKAAQEAVKATTSSIFTAHSEASLAARDWLLFQISRRRSLASETLSSRRILFLGRLRERQVRVGFVVAFLAGEEDEATDARRREDSARQSGCSRLPSWVGDLRNSSLASVEVKTNERHLLSEGGCERKVLTASVAPQALRCAAEVRR